MAQHSPPRRCPVCGSAELIPELELRDFGGDAPRHAVEFVEHPERMLLRGGIASPVRATVCHDCGYVMLFVAQYLGDIRRAYLERRRDGQ